jgi:hypothetical protein
MKVFSRPATLRGFFNAPSHLYKLISHNTCVFYTENLRFYSELSCSQFSNVLSSHSKPIKNATENFNSCYKAAFPPTLVYINYCYNLIYLL